MSSSITYKIIRSRRRTLGVEIRGGEVVVRAPLRCPVWEIERFVRDHLRWIENHLAKAENAKEIRKRLYENKKIAKKMDEKITRVYERVQKISDFER